MWFLVENSLCPGCNALTITVTVSPTGPIASDNIFILIVLLASGFLITPTKSTYAEALKEAI